MKKNTLFTLLLTIGSSFLCSSIQGAERGVRPAHTTSKRHASTVLDEHITMQIKAENMSLEVLTLTIQQAIPEIELLYDENLLKKEKASYKGNVSAQFTKGQLWDFFITSLVERQLDAVVVQSNPLIYKIVKKSDIIQYVLLLDDEQYNAIAFKPSHMLLRVTLNHLHADNAKKMLNVLVRAASTENSSKGLITAEAYTNDSHALLLSGKRHVVDRMLTFLQQADQAGTPIDYVLYQPRRGTATNLVKQANMLWNRLFPKTKSSLSDSQKQRFTAMEDGRILLVGTQADRTAMMNFLKDLDSKEELIEKTYTPFYHTLEQVRTTITTLFPDVKKSGDLKTIKSNSLTRQLLITATARVHEKIQTLLYDLNTAPKAEQLAQHRFTIKYRLADELAGVLRGLLENDSSLIQTYQRQNDFNKNKKTSMPSSQPTLGALPQQSPSYPPENISTELEYSPPISLTEDPHTNMNTQALQTHHLSQVDRLSRKGTQPTTSIQISYDLHTNTILSICTPIEMSRIKELIAQLDIREPQIQIQVILASISADDHRELGLEMNAYDQRQQFATAAVNSANETTDDKFPLAGSPYSFSAPHIDLALNLMENSSQTRVLDRDTRITRNNTTSVIKQTAQIPIASSAETSTGRIVDTTNGYESAGLEISLTPTLLGANEVSLQYSIRNSSFDQSSSIGGMPGKNEKSITNTTVLPDGHAIIVGGIVSQREGESESGIPWLDNLPLLGWAFKNNAVNHNERYFYAFIRVDVVRDFASLRQRTDEAMERAQLEEDGWPKLTAIRILDTSRNAHINIPTPKGNALLNNTELSHE